jgi:hypothetical protein
VAQTRLIVEADSFIIVSQMHRLVLVRGVVILLGLFTPKIKGAVYGQSG